MRFLREKILDQNLRQNSHLEDGKSKAMKETEEQSGGGGKAHQQLWKPREVSILAKAVG